MQHGSWQTAHAPAGMRVSGGAGKEFQEAAQWDAQLAVGAVGREPVEVQVHVAAQGWKISSRAWGQLVDYWALLQGRLK